LSAVAILLGMAPRLEQAVVESVFSAMDIIRCTPGTEAAYWAMARHDDLLRRMTAPQLAKATQILDATNWSSTTH
jgi:hypothetical protein